MASSLIVSSHESPTARTATRTYLGWLLRLVLAERRAWRVIAVAAAIEAALSLTAPYLASVTLDEALPTGAHNMLALLAGSVVVAAAYAAWASWLHQRNAIAIQHRVEAACVEGVMRALLNTSYQDLSSQGYGQINETTAAASATVKLVVQGLVSLLTRGTAAIATFALIAWWFPGLALITVAATSFTVVLSAVHALREAALANDTLRWSGEQRGYYQCLLRALPALRASGAERRLVEAWRRLFHKQVLAAVVQEWATVARKDVLRTGQQILGLGTMAWLVYQVMQGTVTVGQFMTAGMLTANLVHTITECANIGLDGWAMRPHFERVAALFQRASPEAGSVGSHSRTRDFGHAAAPGLRLENVWFRYDEDSPWILQGYEASFPAGQVVVFKAASGSGKTTVLRLVSGLLRPARGEVLVGGFDPSLHRDLVTYLPQQASLFEGSLAANLRTLSGSSLETIVPIARATGLSDWIESLPMGLETLVSAGGRNLSAGQRQLVLLTAAFAKHRPVVLLDEATSQLDAEAIDRIRWTELARGRTVVVVEHTDNVSRSLNGQAA